MRRSRAALLILLILLGLAVAGCGGSDNEASTTTAATTEASGGSGGGTTLNGSVGPGFVISLDGTDGLTPGSYKLVVNDQASMSRPKSAPKASRPSTSSCRPANTSSSATRTQAR